MIDKIVTPDDEKCANVKMNILLIIAQNWFADDLLSDFTVIHEGWPECEECVQGIRVPLAEDVDGGEANVPELCLQISSSDEPM